jgi:hypothetical protein
MTLSHLMINFIILDAGTGLPSREVVCKTCDGPPAGGVKCGFCGYSTNLLNGR